MSGMRTAIAGSVASVIAAGIHLAVVPPHLREAPSHGVFFALLGIAQIASVVPLLRGRWLSTIALANAGVVLLWVVSRFIGLPGSPPEAIGGADIVATGAEVALIAVLLSRTSGIPSARRPIRWSPLLAGVLVLGLFGGVAFGASIPDAHEHGSGDVAGGARHSEHRHASGSVHLHGLYDDAPDPGPDPRRDARAPLDADLIHTGPMPTAVAAGAGAVWVTDREAGTLSAVDPTTSGVRSARIAVAPSAVATGSGFVWVSDFSTDELIRVDPRTLSTARAHVGSGPTAIAVDRWGVWVTSIERGVLQLVDPKTLRIEWTVAVGFGPTAVATDARSVWVVNSLDHALVRVDPKRRSVVGRPIELDRGAAGVAVGFGRIWVASASAGTVNVVDPRTGSRTSVPVDGHTRPGQGPIAVLVAAGRVWIANNHDKTLLSIDPANLSVGPLLFFANELGRYPIGVGLAYQEGSLWISNFQNGTVGRLRVDATPRSLRSP